MESLEEEPGIPVENTAAFLCILEKSSEVITFHTVMKRIAFVFTFHTEKQTQRQRKTQSGASENTLSF